MAKISGTGAAAPDPTVIDLTRLLARLQNTLLSPDVVTERRLRSSSYERQKVQTNLEYARTLLLRLEQDALNIKIQSKKQDVQTDLLKKRDQIFQLSERLKEINAIGLDSASDSSEGEDLLGEYTPSVSAEGEDLVGDDTPSASEDIDGHGTPPEDQPATYPTPKPASPPPTSPPTKPNPRDELFPPALRSRHGAGPSSSPPSRAFTSSSSQAGGSTAMTETLLTHNRAEQESLTSSLLAMATALKTSSVAFAKELDDEKETLERAGDGLERSTGGMEAAQKRMGFLRSVSEGQGWWGRMMLYAWIFGLMFVALFIVGFLPKLRF